MRSPLQITRKLAVKFAAVLLLILAWLYYNQLVDKLSKCEQQQCSTCDPADEVVSEHEQHSSVLSSYSSSYEPDAKLCNQDTFLLVAIVSAAANLERRKAIRETWASVSRGRNDRWPRADRDPNASFDEQVTVLFFVGLPNNSWHQAAIGNESATFGDLVQFGILDSYRNLSLKVQLTLRYTCVYCTSRFVLKADDDVFVNLPALIATLKRQLLRASLTAAQKSDETFVCAENAAGGPVFREGLWRVAEHDYRGTSWPAYCDGVAYAFSHSSACRLHVVAQHFALLPVEDAFVTGVLREALRMRIVADRHFARWADRPAAVCHFLAGHHVTSTNYSPQEMLRLWRSLHSDVRC